MKKIAATGSISRARHLRKNVTEAEKKLWAILSHRTVDGFKFRRQVPLGFYIVDFVSHEAKLIIEVDGGQHDVQSHADAERTAFLNQQGYKVLRFWNNDVLSNMDGVAETIMNALSRSHPNLSPLTGEGQRPVENN